jgi:molybdopterin/thiamine biosynthesis adenylyltransferase
LCDHNALLVELLLYFKISATMHSPTVDKQNSMTSEKNMKYDRQLRLWQEWGQRDLENSKICLINATAVGTETLKNIILPGSGYFTIIDDSLLTEEDLSNK